MIYEHFVFFSHRWLTHWCFIEHHSSMLRIIIIQYKEYKRHPYLLLFFPGVNPLLQFLLCNHRCFYLDFPLQILFPLHLQTKCEAAYFVIVLHDLKSVVISVRGTETPEDLLTDGLCRNCTLSTDDLDGIIK